MEENQIDRNLDFQRAMLYLEDDTAEKIFLLWRFTRTWPVRYPREERLIPWWKDIEDLLGVVL